MTFACMVHKGLSVIKEREIPELGPNEVLVRILHVIFVLLITDSGWDCVNIRDIRW